MNIAKLVFTFAEAFVLVVLVVFLFLGDTRSTLIPVLAVPVSLIGSLFFIQLLGFSLNLITLFSLVLAIGIVVDNAIVVVEAVHHKMQLTAMPPREATEEAMGEIGPAIIAITLVMTAVFVPMGFIEGPAGIFYRQFALTTAIAIVLSGVVALTLTPALCALLLRPHTGEHAPRGPLRWFMLGYDAVERRYESLLRRSAGRRLLTLGVLVAFLVSTGFVARLVPPGFIPEEDQGVFYVSTTTPAGSTLERTKSVVDAIQAASKGIEGIESVATLAGSNVLSDGTGATYGTALVNLVPWEERTQSVQEIMERLRLAIRHIHDADIELFPPPAIPGYGNASGFELRLLDKTGLGDFKDTERVVGEFVEHLRSRPEIDSAFSIFSASFPEYTLNIDLDRAAQKGVSARSAL